MEVKDNSKIAATQTKRLATSKAALVNYGSDASVRVTRNNKSRTGVLLDHNQQGNKTFKNHGAQNYYVLYNK